eukprot:7382570-Prymnesium_polylepis.2
MWSGQPRLTSRLKNQYIANRPVHVPFRRTFYVKYDGHNNQKVHISMHAKDHAQLHEMSNFFTVLGFTQNEIPISNVNKYPVPHLKLTPDPRIYSCA